MRKSVYVVDTKNGAIRTRVDGDKVLQATIAHGIPTKQMIPEKVAKKQNRRSVNKTEIMLTVEKDREKVLGISEERKCGVNELPKYE